MVPPLGVADFLGVADKVGKVNKAVFVTDELLLPPGSSMSIAPCHNGGFIG